MSVLKFARIVISDFIEENAALIDDSLNKIGFLEKRQEDTKAPRIFISKDGLNLLRTHIKAQAKAQSDLDPLLPNQSEILAALVKDAKIWIYDDALLPKRSVIVEVRIDNQELENNLEKNNVDAEGEVWKLSCYIYSFFSNEGKLFEFSERAIRNVSCRNIVVEFVFESDRPSIDKLNNKILNYLDDYNSNRRGQVAYSAIPVIDELPIKFSDPGFSDNRSLIIGYAGTTFAVGTIVQGDLRQSAPMYLETLISSDDVKNNPIVILEDKPVLQMLGGLPIRDFSAGCGQIVMLQLLNTWNRHVENVVPDSGADTQNSDDIAHSRLDKAIREIKVLSDTSVFNIRIDLKFRNGLLSLSNNSRSTFSLQETPILSRSGLLAHILMNEKQDTTSGVVSSFSKLIAADIETNQHKIDELKVAKKFRIDALSLEESLRTNRKMMLLTLVVAFLTALNVLLYAFRYL